METISLDAEITTGFRLKPMLLKSQMNYRTVEWRKVSQMTNDLRYKYFSDKKVKQLIAFIKSKVINNN